MKPISFLHCADIHLGHLQFNEHQRLLDFAAAFRQVVDYALDKQVNFILLSGDFFHKRAINAQTLQQAIELLAPLREAAIPVLAIEGNHDKAFYQDKNSWLAFLNNQGFLNLLTPRFEEGRLVLTPWEEETRTGSWIDLPGVRVYGTGYLGVTTSSRLTEVENYVESQDDNTIILMLHVAINRLLGQDLGGIRKELLEPFRSKVDYLALGHIHSRYEVDDWIYNPGALECIHLDEYGPEKEKGFYHITIGPQGRDIEYVPSCCRPVSLYTINLTGSRDPEDVYELVYEEMLKNRLAQGAIVQVKLQGDVAYSPLNLDTAGITERLKEEFSCLYLEVQNLTNLPAEGSFREGSSVKREDIEKLVFGQLLLRERNWDPRQMEEAVQVVKGIKEMSLSGEPEEELIKLLMLYGEKLLVDSSASGENQEGCQDDNVDEKGVSA